CPACQLVLIRGDLEKHLRSEHGLVLYQGVHRSVEDTFEAMVRDFLRSANPGPILENLLGLAREEHPESPERFLASQLVKGLTRGGIEPQDPSLPALAALMSPSSPRMLLALGTRPDALSRTLALHGFRSLAVPLDSRLRHVLRMLVCDPELEEDLQLEILALTLPQLDEIKARRLLRRLLRKRSRSSALDLLLRIENWLEDFPLITTMRSRLEQKLRLQCPRCGKRHRLASMRKHLWRRHRLILDGTRVRQPWDVIAGWLKRGQRDRAQETWAERARIAARKVDPQGGEKRLERLMMSLQMADSNTRDRWLSEAQNHHAALCPACYSLVPIPPEHRPYRLRFRGNRLSAMGFQVVLREEGFRPSLEILTPQGVLYRGADPEQPLTLHGLSFLCAAMATLAALACSIAWPRMLGSPLRPVICLLVAAYLLTRVVRMFGRWRPTMKERLLSAVSSKLIPSLHSGSVRLEDSGFAAGFVSWQAAHGREELSTEAMRRLARITEEAVSRKTLPDTHLAPLVRLIIEDAHEEGQTDPVLLTARYLERCFRGEYTFDFAQDLLENWQTGWWTVGNLARLRVLLADRAFEAGFEVGTLVDASLLAPALGAVLEVDSLRSLAALRLIWSLRSSRPWGKLGSALTAFELCQDARNSWYFERFPGLLLMERDERYLLQEDVRGLGLAPLTIAASSAGLWIQDILLSIPPRTFEIQRRGKGSRMVLGRAVFSSPNNLEPVADLLERWFRWIFHEFQPEIAGAATWVAPDRKLSLRSLGAVVCPECALPLVAKVGEVGSAVTLPDPNHQQRS
ncbi:MAG: hypothetical protein ACKO23_20685, partial [Gemmataceae bacterium]